MYVPGVVLACSVGFWSIGDAYGFRALQIGGSSVDPKSVRANGKLRGPDSNRCIPGYEPSRGTTPQPRERKCTPSARTESRSSTYRAREKRHKHQPHLRLHHSRIRTARLINALPGDSPNVG